MNNWTKPRMKKDLSNLLFESKYASADELKDYLVNYILEIILIELESLPKDQWDKVLKTWEKILIFSYNMLKKPIQEREKLYEKFRFDGMMKTIVENLIEAFKHAFYFGLLKEGDHSKKLLTIALEHVIVMNKKDLSPECIEWIKNKLR